MKRSVVVAICLFAGLSILGPSPSQAYGVHQEAKLTASDGQDGDRFGFCALDGDTAVITAFRDEDNGYESGSAYVFTRSGDTWAEQVKLLPSDGDFYDRFGHCVAVEGDTAIIGAPLADSNDEQSGAAYVFTRSGGSWFETAKLVPQGVDFYDHFGCDIALDGDTAIIGATGDSDNGIRAGAAYVFTRNGGTWTEQAKLLASDIFPLDEVLFGLDIALDGDTAVIGALRSDLNGERSGVAYVFTGSGGVWTEEAKLMPTDASSNQHFGGSVAVDGDTAIVGAYWDNDRWGAAYAFTRSGGVWTQQAKLRSPDSGQVFFGWSVGLEGDTAVISAIWTNANGHHSGAAHVFTRSGGVWNRQARILASDGAEGDFFGQRVALDGDTVMIGATDHAPGGGAETGAAYAFRLMPGCGDGIVDPGGGEECDDGGNISCDGCSQGCRVEVGYVCGDGILNADCGEQCDDGNNDDGDGCTSTCLLEHAVPAISPVGLWLLVLALGGGGAYWARRAAHDRAA
jgi:cysteine-rich repeat protein